MGPASFNYSYVIGEGCVTGVDGDKWYGGFEDSVFEQHVLDFIRESPADAQPVFIFWAPHIVHTPLQVPEPWLQKFDFMKATDKDTHERQIYHSMVHFADAAVGNVTQKLKEDGHWCVCVCVCVCVCRTVLSPTQFLIQK